MAESDYSVAVSRGQTALDIHSTLHDPKHLASRQEHLVDAITDLMVLAHDLGLEINDAFMAAQVHAEHIIGST